LRDLDTRVYYEESNVTVTTKSRNAQDRYDGETFYISQKCHWNELLKYEFSLQQEWCLPVTSINFVLPSRRNHVCHNKMVKTKSLAKISLFLLSYHSIT
jgi:hypothetical protein